MGAFRIQGPDGKEVPIRVRKLTATERMKEDFEQSRGPMRVLHGILLMIRGLWLLFWLGVLIWFVVLVVTA
jgi:hypothetical protein